MIDLNIEADLFRKGNDILDSAQCNDLPTVVGTLARTKGKFGLGSVLLRFRDGTTADFSQDPITDSMPALGLQELSTAIDTGRIVVNGTLYIPASAKSTEDVGERPFPTNEADIEKINTLYTAAGLAIQYM